MNPAVEINSQKLKRRLKLRDLDTLMTVVSAGGMHKAAEQLHVSQPAVSKAIADLESTLGVRLLERSRQGIEVTRYGEVLLRRATSMFDELQQSARELEHLADPQGGELSYGCGETANAGLACIAVERLTRQYPRLRFKVESGDWLVLHSHFLRERICELVITRPWEPTIDPDINGEPLFREQLRVVVGQDHPMARRRKIGLAELANERWIFSQNEVRANSPVVAAFAAVGLPIPTCAILTGSLNVRYSVLATGRFITMMPHSLLKLGAVRLPVKVLPIELPWWRYPMMIFTLKNRSVSPLAELFIDTVRELSRPLAASQVA